MDAAKAEMKARMAEAKLKQQQKLNQVFVDISKKTFTPC
jgi:hypothetical protein